jgi:SAM-dependent methyltransferase
MKNSDSPLDTCFRFMKSRLILTAAELDLFTQIHDSSPNAGELAEKTGLDVRATTRLLDALVTLDLLEKENGRYACTDAGAPLSSTHKGTILPMILHLNGLWDTWSHLTETVRDGINPQRDMSIKRDEARQKAFIGAMHVIGRELSMEIADSYDLSPFKKLLDIGGGSGTYTITFLKKNSKMTAIIFDLEDVIPLAEERLIEEGFQDRVVLESGNYYVDPLPEGCDLALLSAIIHQNSPKQNVDLFQKVYRALNPGGVVLIRDHIMDDSRTHPPDGAVFALNMLVNTEGGDSYTFGEVKDALEEAGFVDVKMPREGERMDCLVEARKA